MNDKLTEEEAKAGDKVIIGLILFFGLPLWVWIANMICVIGGWCK